MTLHFLTLLMAANLAAPETDGVHPDVVVGAPQTLESVDAQPAAEQPASEAAPQIDAEDRLENDARAPKTPQPQAAPPSRQPRQRSRVAPTAAPLQPGGKIPDDVALTYTLLPPHGNWRVALGGGSQHILTARLRWFTEHKRSTAFYAVLQRDFADIADWLAGLHGHLGTTANFGAKHEGFDLLELRLGVGYDLLRHGVWDFVFPYARIDFLLGRATLRAGGEGATKPLVGVAPMVGFRVALPRMGRREINRLYLFAEGGYDARADRAFTLRPNDASRGLPGPGTSLGTINLSGYSVLLGGGIQL